jgi:hypothetical protein
MPLWSRAPLPMWIALGDARMIMSATKRHALTPLLREESSRRGGTMVRHWRPCGLARRPGNERLPAMDAKCGKDTEIRVIFHSFRPRQILVWAKRWRSIAY